MIGNFETLSRPRSDGKDAAEEPSSGIGAS